MELDLARDVHGKKKDQSLLGLGNLASSTSADVQA